MSYVSSKQYIPKLHAALKLVQQIMARGEQVVIFSAFQDSLDALSGHLHQAGVSHVVADGRMSQKRRGDAIKKFKIGNPRALREGIITFENAIKESPERSRSAGGPCGLAPVLLAGVESVAEGHSMNLCNNVILMCYSWAFDKFEQAINRAHRLNSPWPVNVYPIICDNSIDRKLEAMIQEKGDAAELVLDGHLLGEHASEVNLAELLDVARKEFNNIGTVDEVELAKEWPPLRAELAQLMIQWSHSMVTLTQPVSETETVARVVKKSPLWRRRLCAAKLDTTNLPLWRQIIT